MWRAVGMQWNPVTFQHYLMEKKKKIRTPEHITDFYYLEMPIIALY